MMNTVASVKPEDIRRIKISCRCGEKNIAEVPQQLARMVNIHVCSKCSAVFGIQKREDGSWKIKRIEMEEGVAMSPNMMRRLMEGFMKKVAEMEKDGEAEDTEKKTLVN